jgi:hypothetical protein
LTFDELEEIPIEEHQKFYICSNEFKKDKEIFYKNNSL